MYSSRYNSALAAARREALDGVYDIHSNMVHYPQIMQPTHARWEEILPESTVDSNGEHVNTDENQASENILHDARDIDGKADKAKTDTIFPPVPSIIRRNYMIADTYFIGAPQPDMPYPGPDGDLYDIGARDLTHVTQDVIDELDDYCKAEFYKARAQLIEWKKQWDTETRDGGRAPVRITYNN